MNNYNKLLNNLETLKLLKIRDNIDNYIDLINSKKKGIIDSLYELTNLEIDLLKEKESIIQFNLQGSPFKNI